jgi:hypothetical protein
MRGEHDLAVFGAHVEHIADVDAGVSTDMGGNCDTSFLLNDDECCIQHGEVGLVLVGMPVGLGYPTACSTNHSNWVGRVKAWITGSEEVRTTSRVTNIYPKVVRSNHPVVIIVGLRSTKDSFDEAWFRDEPLDGGLFEAGEVDALGDLTTSLQDETGSMG